MEEEMSVVPVDEIKEVQADIEGTIRNVISTRFDFLQRKSLSIKRQDPSYRISVAEKTQLDEKETAIYNYIASNPETTKQSVVDSFEGNPGYSRNPVYSAIKRLQQYELITVKPDKNNKQKHKLSINEEYILLDLNQVLSYFKNIYNCLIEKTKQFISRENNLAPVTSVELVECLMMIYKFTKNKFSDFFLWYGKLCDSDTLHRKFGIIHESMEEIVRELYQGLVDAKFFNRSEEMERFLNYSRSDVLGPENLTFIISSFEKCGLREYVEPIIDFLWSLFYRKLPLLYLEYTHLSIEGKLNDWRDIEKGRFVSLSCKRKILYCPTCNDLTQQTPFS
jgi:hypothetical protein